jgi:hypothetical protein
VSKIRTLSDLFTDPQYCGSRSGCDQDSTGLKDWIHKGKNEETLFFGRAGYSLLELGSAQRRRKQIERKKCFYVFSCELRNFLSRKVVWDPELLIISTVWN